MFNLKFLNLKLCLTIILTSVIFLACDNQSLSPEFQEQSIPSTLKVSALDCDEFARTLAMSLEDKKVRGFLKNEASKMQDGDYDIIYRMVNTKDVNGKSLENVLASKMNGFAKGVSAIDRMKGITESTPLLNIFIHNIDKWSEELYEPLVAVAPIETGEKPKTLKAYDKTGNIVYIDAQKVPDNPVIVVGLNERMSFDKGIFKNKYKNVISSNKAKKERLSNARVMYNCTYPFRQDNKWETCKGTWFSDLQHYEDWFLGGPELKISYQAFFKSNNSVADFEAHLSTTRACSANEFWSFQFDAFEWNSQYYHDYIYVTFIEEDGGSEMEDSITVPIGNGVSATLKTKYKQDDDIIRKNYPIQKPNCPPSFWQSCAEYRANDDFWFYSTSDYQIYN